MPFAALVAVALIAVIAWPVQAQQAAPVWSQFQGGPGHAGVLKDGPEPPYRPAWTFRVFGGALSGAVIVGDVVISVGRSAVYGIDLATGERRWQLVRNGGPISMPAVGVAANRQVLAFVDEAEGVGASLVGVDLTDMREVWRTPLEATSRSGVTVDGATAFIADDDGNIYAVNLATGALRWTAKAIGEVLAPPAVSDGIVHVSAIDSDSLRGQLLALDVRTGRKAWEFSPQVGVTTVSGPSAGDGSVVAGFEDRMVRSFVADGGEERWGALTISVFPPATAPAIQPGMVFVADFRGGLYRLNSRTGHRDWDHQNNDLVVRSSPVVSGGAVLLGLEDGRLVAFDISSGDLVWQGAPSPGSIGPIALSPDVVVAAVAAKGGSRAGLVAFKHDPEGTLVRDPSPTEVDPARLFGNYAIALVVTTLVLFVPLRLLARRLGPPAFAGGEEGTEEGAE